MLKQLVFAMALSVSAGVMAQGQTCAASAAEKKLAGAAKTSHLQKCEKDAKAACEAASKEKNLHGAAKTSFEKKCLKDAVG
jgi:hypothetical protein